MAAKQHKSEAETIQPTDGGWGWVIVVSIFLLRFLSPAALQSIGVTFDLLIADFGCSKSEVGVMGSISFSLTCFLAPIVSVLQNRYGTRAVILTGAAIISVSFTLSAFAPNIYFLYFSIGVLGGFGMALIYLPGMVVVSYYFKSRRTLATALSGIGSYFGCFVYPFLIRYITSLFGWRGAFFILGAITLNSIPAALLLRPQFSSSKSKGEPEPTEMDDDGVKWHKHQSANATQLETFVEETVTESHDDEIAENEHKGVSDQKDDEVQHLARSVGALYHRELSTNPGSKRKRTMTEGAPTFERSRSFCPSDISIFRSSGGIYTPINPLKEPPSELSLVSLLHRTYTPPTTNKAAAQTSVIKDEQKDDVEASPEDKNEEERKKSLGRKAADYFIEMFRMFGNPDLAAFFLANTLICLAYYLPALFISDWGKSLGMPPERTVVLLSLIGPGNMIGRPVVAAVGDCFAPYRTVLFSMMLIIGGFVTVIVAYFPSFYFIAFFVFQFAFLIGGTQTMLTAILADIVPLDKLGFSFGILLLCEGIAILLGPPLLVLFPSYNITFTVAGLIIIAGGLPLLIVRFGKHLLNAC